MSDKGKAKNRPYTKGKPSNGRMGSSTSARKGVVITDTDGEESFRSAPRKLPDYLAQLSDCKGKAKKEEALSAIVHALTMDVKLEFVEENFATLVYQCLCCIKKGSAMELELGLQAVGLTGMILEDEDHAHGVYQDSLHVLSRVLDSSSGSIKKVKIFGCLAMVTFFGANSSDETETVMQIIWKFLSNENNKKYSGSSVLAAAISAWSFLLTTIDGWRINHKYWQGSISYLLNLLEESDESVYVAAAEALALIVETNSLEKFSTRGKDSSDGDNSDSLTSAKIDSLKQELKDDITKKLRRKETQESEDGAKREAKIDVLKFFEAGKYLKTYAKIGKDAVMVSTWSQRIQLNYVKSFIGEDGFVKHMRANENLHAIFEYTPARKNNTNNVLYIPEEEEVRLRFFQPKVKQEDGSLLPFVSRAENQLLKKMTQSPNSCLNKARTRLLNKKRMASHATDISSITIDDE